MTDQNIFFKKKNKLTFCDKCNSCKRTCKQSFRATLVACPKYKEAAPRRP